MAEGALTEATVNRALGYQRVSGDRLKLGTILLNWDVLAEEGLLQTLARHHRVEAVPWSVLSTTPIEVTRLIPQAMAIRLGAFPYAATKTTLHVVFLEPSNLAAQDEIAAVTARRVIPAVALEIRLLEAHQKFYGRHIPLEYRAILQKIERRTAKARRPEWQNTIDFRAPDLLGAERSAEFAQSAGTPIPILRGYGDRDLVGADAALIEVPEMPMPAPPPRAAARPPADADALSDTRPAGAAAATRTFDAADRMSDTHPVRSGAPEPEDTLSKRMGRPFASLSQGERPPAPPEVVEKIEFRPDHSEDTRPRRRRAPPASRPPARGDGDDTLPRGASAHFSRRDAVADMWRPAALEHGEDAAALRMWNLSAPDVAASMGEARSRDEISQVALDTLLADLPRVLLLGCGKTAIAGWQGRGADLTAETVASIRIPLSESNVFAAVRDSGVPHFGPLERVQWPKALAERLGEKAPDCAVFPIRILDGIAAFLYVDRVGEQMHYEDFAVVARASAATANSLARFLLRRGNPAPVV